MSGSRAMQHAEHTHERGQTGTCPSGRAALAAALAARCGGRATAGQAVCWHPASPLLRMGGHHRDRAPPQKEAQGTAGMELRRQSQQEAAPLSSRVGATNSSGARTSDGRHGQAGNAAAASAARLTAPAGCVRMAARLTAPAGCVRTAARLTAPGGCGWRTSWCAAAPWPAPWRPSPPPGCLRRQRAQHTAARW